MADSSLIVILQNFYLKIILIIYIMMAAKTVKETLQASLLALIKFSFKAEP